ncbi:hypothetical protein [Photorhabdus sp. SF281]|uniref:hypothetical protein n=1 Tax=Photorhabdus sp. SF281 TaxID=3459527 RepID=UPI004044EEEC
MASHCVQDNAQNLGNTTTARATHGHGDNFAPHVRRINVIKNCDRRSPSYVIRVAGLPVFTFLSGSIVSQAVMTGDSPVFASLSGIKRNNDNYHVNYL